MKLRNLRIQHFRAIDDLTVEFDGYTCLVGANGAGKSTVLTALNILFRSPDPSLEGAHLTREDYRNQDTSKPVVITATFVDLTPEAQSDFEAYYRNGALVITTSAEWDETTSRGVPLQFGERSSIRDFSAFFEDGKQLPELKAIYAKLCEAYPDLPAIKTKAGMTEALRQYEESHTELCSLVRSTDQFYGFSKGANLLARHIQWVFVPAVKDATTEAVEAKQTALGQLLARTVRAQVSFAEGVEAIRDSAQLKYEEMLASQKKVLDDLSESLGGRLRQWSHPGAGVEVVWDQDPATSVKIAEPSASIRAEEGGFKGRLPRFGHGLQRSYLLALLQELAAAPTTDQPTLVLGVEEPELFQHPPQARHLAEVLQSLGADGAQAIVCSHSPLFVQGDQLWTTRVFRRHGGSAPSVHRCSEVSVSKQIAVAFDEEPKPVAATVVRLHQCLNSSVREMFFAPSVVLVEGIEDEAYLTAWLQLTSRWDLFRELGGHIVPAGGKSFMVRPLAILRDLETPVFCMFDADSNQEKHWPSHLRDNSALLKLMGYSVDDWSSHRLERDVAMWSTCLGAAARESVGAEAWAAAHDSVKSEHKMHVKTDSVAKSPLYVGYFLHQLLEAGVGCKLLDDLCLRVLAFLRGDEEPMPDEETSLFAA